MRLTATEPALAGQRSGVFLLRTLSLFFKLARQGPQIWLLLAIPEQTVTGRLFSFEGTSCRYAQHLRYAMAAASRERVAVSLQNRVNNQGEYTWSGHLRIAQRQ